MSRPAHFNHAGASIPPPEIVDRVIRHLRLEAEIGGYEAAEQVDDEHEQVFDALAALVGADRNEVVPVESATRAWESVLWSMAHSGAWGRHDRVVVDRFAYASCWATLLRLQAVTGIDLAVAPSGADGAVDPTRLAEAVDDRTRLVLVTHVPTHVGTVSDVGAVGRLLAGGPAVYAVDASQSIGQIDVQVREIGCQVAFAPGRKFLRAPRGTGLLFVADELAGDLVPISIDLTTAVSLDVGSFALRDGARRFDPFEHSLALRLGLGEAARHAGAIGLERIQAGVEERSRAVADLVDRTPGMELLAPAPLSGIVSFVHARLDPTEVRAQLSAAGVQAWVASLGGSPLDQADRLSQPAVRLSPHWDTTDSELESLERALGALA